MSIKPTDCRPWALLIPTADLAHEADDALARRSVEIAFHAARLGLRRTAAHHMFRRCRRPVAGSVHSDEYHKVILVCGFHDRPLTKVDWSGSSEARRRGATALVP